MSSPRIPVTKIQPPRLRVAHLARQRLDEALAGAVRAHRVVLLQAAAGFGKTSALSALWAGLPAAWGRAWISLDEDEDAERLFASLVDALEPLDLPWRTAPEALVTLAGGRADECRRAAAELVNALADADAPHGVIVLDDLHRVADDGVLQLLAVLLERGPANWTLVLSSRVPPALPLARLRLAGELAEFDQEALRFDGDEARRMLAGEAPGVAAQAATLFERTGGWPAGLRLALAALRNRPEARPGGPIVDRHLFDYLAVEVLDDMPPALQDFLLRTAVLPELTAARAAAVSGDAQAAERLDEIERRGLFVTALEANERTLVLHDLLRDALMARLRLRLPDELPALLRKAAAGETDPVRRAGFLMRAGDWPAAETVITAAATDLFVQGGANELLRLAEQFPTAARSARLQRMAGAAAGLRWQWGPMAAWLEAAVAAARAAGDGAELRHAQAYLANALYPLDRNAEADALAAEVLADAQAPAVARTLALMAAGSQDFRRGAHDDLVARYGEALALLERGMPLLAWWECVPPINWSTIRGMAALFDRYLAGAGRQLALQAEAALPMRPELRLLGALQHLWAGRMADWRHGMAEAESDLQWLAVSGELRFGVELVRLIGHAIQGQEEAFEQRLGALMTREDGAPESRRRLWQHQMAIYGVRLSDTLELGPQALARWAALVRENPLADPQSMVPRAQAIRARHAAAAGRWAEAADRFDALAPHLPVMDVMGQRTDLTLRHAHALLRAGRVVDAARVATPVLERLRDEGVRGQALLCGPRLLRTLADAGWAGRLAPSLQAELDAVAALSASLRGPAAAVSVDGDEALSGREREVLERIAAGDSNKLIARALDISPHTVKRHVANILGKLGLVSRGQAAAWLRDHG